MLHILPQQYHRTPPPVVAVARVVEIIMASEAAMCNTKYDGTEADAAVQKLKLLFAAEIAYAGNCSFPGAHVVIPAPGKAECETYRG